MYASKSDYYDYNFTFYYYSLFVKSLIILCTLLIRPLTFRETLSID